MLNKINFDNGQIVRRDYLKEVQKGTSFSGSSRDNYYAEPTETEHDGWSIGQRDKIKDWEISDPTSEPQSVLGRLVYDGMVLGYDTLNDTPVYGPAALVNVLDGQGVWVEGGKAILSDGEIVTWQRQLVQLIDATQPNYIFLSEELARSNMALGSPVQLSIDTSLPSVTYPHIPLAKLTLSVSGDKLLLGEEDNNSSVAGYGYVDLRPSTHIGNLNTYPRNLINTDLISNSVQIDTWKRAIVDTSNGSLVVTLPSNPENSDRIAIADISGTFDKYPVILRVPGGSDYRINGSVDDWIINIRDAHLELYYNIDTNQWKFEESPGGECTPLMGTFLSCGGKEYIGDRLPEECPDGGTIPAVYPNPSEGIYEYDLGTGKCYKKYNETVAIYANGQGGLITVTQAQRCLRRDPGEAKTGDSKVRNVIYVDPSIGDDSIDNSGFDPSRPFRTPERALIEATRESRRSGAYNDRYDRILIELSPGDYYVDNSPGSGNTTNITSEAGLIQRVSTSLTIQTSIQGDRATIIQIDSGNVSLEQPPVTLKLGRVLYSESGGVGNIAKLEKVSPSTSIWRVTLEYVRGNFNREDELFYDNLSVVNPVNGGVIVPRGVSINGVDLRKVRVRPMYVPTLSPVQDDPQMKTSIWKVTGGSYVSLQTFTDNLQYARTHNTVTSVTFASRSELEGDETTVSYYAKINSLFGGYDSWGGDGLEFLGSESTIVAPVPTSYNYRQQDTEENQTGFPQGDSRGNVPVSYPGASRIKYSGDVNGTAYNLPDINSTRSSSPYVFNCSVRSIFGLNGLHADGSLVDGLKSMVTANFTQVSMQTDPNCYDEGTYYADPPANEQQGGAKRFKQSAADQFKYRNIGFRGSNDAVIQIVSCFVIGNSDHFVSDSGGDLSITNSCSDFGDVSLKAIGYKGRAFSQDEGAPAGEYTGTRMLKIIPPLPLTYNQPTPTIEDVDISTGLGVDYDATLAYVVANSTNNDMPTFYRVYIKNDINAPFTLTTPPSASSMGFGQYSYTKLNSSNDYVLTGGDLHPERKRVYITGFDENANSIVFSANIVLPDPETSPGFSALDDRSKIFSWDSTKQLWYVTVNTGGIVDETTPNANGFLLKRLDYAFRFKIITPVTVQEQQLNKLNFIFNGNPIKTIRGVDNRSDDERVYRLVLSGFKRSAGIRRPQPYYIVEKQAGVAGGPLNLGPDLKDDPLTVTSMKTYAEVKGYSLNDPDIPDEYDGQYVTYLVQSERARRVFEGNLYPSLDYDEPETTEDPSSSITKVALIAMLERPGVWFSGTIAPSFDEISIKTGSAVSTPGIRIGLRRPSIIRASGHTWEWTGYLNYDTALPAFQNNPLDEKFALAKIIDEQIGGRVYATGMNEEGNYYIGTTVFDLRSGEQFAIPYKNDTVDEAISNQVFNNVVIRSSLLLADESSVILGKRTTIFVNNTTRIKSLTTGDISASNSQLPEIYATQDRAGLVQLAKTSDIRGAAGSAQGIASKVVVTAADLATELSSRFNNAVQGGDGVIVDIQSVEVPGGDPNDPADNVDRFVVSVDPVYSGFVPVGGIIMWSGSIAQINSLNNWKLCDGNNGTPDLRNKFVIGSSIDDGGVSKTQVEGPSTRIGGTKDAIIPTHNHTADVATSGRHTHTFELSNDEGSFNADGGQGGFVTDTGSDRRDGTLGPASSGKGNQIGGAHLGDTDGEGRHTHAVTINYRGEDATNKNLPPYYALAYIMRIA